MRAIGQPGGQPPRKVTIEIMTMKETASVTKDPICGMTVDKATAIHIERDGETFYFCSDHCRQIQWCRVPKDLSF